ncbi:hypothetical protein ACF0H5_019046 [Mactra antiquata]
MESYLPQNVVLCCLVFFWTLIGECSGDEVCYNDQEEEIYDCIAGCCHTNGQVHCCVANSIIIVLILAILICVVISVVAICGIVKIDMSSSRTVQPQTNYDDETNCDVSIVQNYTGQDIVTIQPIKPPPYSEAPPPSYETLGIDLSSNQKRETHSGCQTSDVQLNTHGVSNVPQLPSHTDIYNLLHQRQDIGSISRPPPLYTRGHRVRNLFSLFRRDHLDPPPQYS